jgi:transposase
MTKQMQQQEEEFAACVGLDWGDKEHSICLQAAGNGKVEHGKVPHRPEELDAWVVGLRKRFEGRPVAVCVELTRGPVVSVLLQHEFISIFSVNPQTLARYREAWAPSGAKDDPSDAQLALEVLVKHRDKLTMLKPQSAPMRALQRLVEDRRRVVDQRVRLTNRLTAALKQYFPQALEWFEDKGTLLFCDFLERWDSPEKARRARQASVESFMKEHNVRYAARIEERFTGMRKCIPLTTDPGVVMPSQQAVRALVPMLRATITAIVEYDALIAKVESQLKDRHIFRSFPAAADVFAPRLMALFGEDRERFQSAAEVQRYGGVAPVTERSGNSTWVHWRYRCSKFFRQTLVEWVGLTIPHSYWAEQFYRQQRARGAGHQAALRALAYKWVRILFRCWKAGETYDESRYLKALNKRGSTLLLEPKKSTT